jgi:chemotaxis signal transduction protein
MTGGAGGGAVPGKTAEFMRRAFDEAFATAAVPSPEGLLALLAIRVRKDPFALRVSDLARLETRRKVVPLPAGDPSLLGIAGIRGRLVPVYSLAALLGLPVAREEGRWLAICRCEAPVALAFDEMEGHLRVSPSELHPVDSGKGHVRHAGEAIRMGAEVRLVLDIPSILAGVQPAASGPTRRGSGQRAGRAAGET